MPVFAFTAGSFGDILSAAGLAAKIATTLYDSSDVSAECRASMSELQALQQTLLWIRTAVEFYDHTPIGNALRHIVHQEVAQCHLEMRHFDDHLEKYRRHLVYTKIASVCFRVWSAATSDLASLSNKLAACRSRLAMMLVMLNSFVSFSPERNALCAYAVDAIQRSIRRAGKRYKGASCAHQGHANVSTTWAAFSSSCARR
ncbi:hypothetical protein K439DRAFT_1141933 [Ramaria rubella]|nr:hypothetical protein K439DRAFT_1141933 [Ramaria rubella]